MRNKYLLISAAFLAIFVAGCASLQSIAASVNPVKTVQVPVVPARTNFVTIPVTNTIEKIVIVTNFVQATAASTNAAGAFVPPTFVQQTDTKKVVEQIITTNVVPVVTPAITWSSNYVAPWASTGVEMGGNIAGVAGVPFASTAASGILALSTLVLGFLNRKAKAKAMALAAGREEDQSALEIAKMGVKTLVENIEQIRGVAKQIPGYTKELDGKIMTGVQLAQYAAGSEVKSLIEETVNKTTEDTWGGHQTELAAAIAKAQADFARSQPKL